jgi:hypothetical protein
MRIEYSAPLHLHQDTSLRNVEDLVQKAEVPRDAVHGDPMLLARMARSYLRRDDFDRSMLAMSYAVDVAAGVPVDGAASEARARIRGQQWGPALASMAATVDGLQAQDPPPIAFLAEWETWRDELAKWARDDEGGPGK